MMPAMRVGLDARAAFLDPHRGFGRVTRAVADALLEVLSGELVVFVPHGAAIPPRWYRLGAGVVHLRRPHRAAFLVDGPAWAWTLHRNPVDVLHLPAWGVPPGLPVPVVATFYDATPLRFPSPPAAWPRRRAGMAIRSLRRANRVHAISEHARAELLAAARVKAESVRTVHLGVGPPFAPVDPAPPPGGILFVGGADPHKNLELLLQTIRLPGAEALPPLVLAGPAARDSVLTRRVGELGLRSRVQAKGLATDDELADAYRSALALVLPSRNEGFGLPVLEAMACGCPVIAARAGALPEVCGDAAILLDPDDPAAWRDALLGLCASPGRRAELRAAGLARAATFTWRRTAERLIALYREATRAPSARS